MINATLLPGACGLLVGGYCRSLCCFLLFLLQNYRKSVTPNANKTQIKELTPCWGYYSHLSHSVNFRLLFEWGVHGDFLLIFAVAKWPAPVGSVQGHPWTQCYWYPVRFSSQMSQTLLKSHNKRSMASVIWLLLLHQAVVETCACISPTVYWDSWKDL